jgi:hypothetical protein
MTLVINFAGTIKCFACVDIGEYDSKHKVGNFKHRHPHHPQAFLPWPHHSMIMFISTLNWSSGFWWENLEPKWIMHGNDKVSPTQPTSCHKFMLIPSPPPLNPEVLQSYFPFHICAPRDSRHSELSSVVQEGSGACGLPLTHHKLQNTNSLLHVYSSCYF